MRDGAGWLPIHEAAFHDHADIAVYLLDKGAYLDDMGCQEDLSTPLFEAIHGDALKTAIVLVNRGANLWHVWVYVQTCNLIHVWELVQKQYGLRWYILYFASPNHNVIFWWSVSF